MGIMNRSDREKLVRGCTYDGDELCDGVCEGCEFNPKVVVKIDPLAGESDDLDEDGIEDDEWDDDDYDDYEDEEEEDYDFDDDDGDWEDEYEDLA